MTTISTDNMSQCQLPSCGKSFSNNKHLSHHLHTDHKEESIPPHTQLAQRQSGFPPSQGNPEHRAVAKEARAPTTAEELRKRAVRAIGLPSNQDPSPSSILDTIEVSTALDDYWAKDEHDIYVVYIGRVRGLFSDKKLALDSIKKFPGALAKSFKDLSTALSWMDACQKSKLYSKWEDSSLELNGLIIYTTFMFEGDNPKVTKRHIYEEDGDYKWKLPTTDAEKEDGCMFTNQIFGVPRKAFH